MSGQQKHRIQVPDGLRDVLLEFSIAYLLEQPGDVIDYAVEFFSKLQENRKTTMITSNEPVSPDESIMSHEEEPLVNRYASRRKSVFAETYDPENDDDDDGARAIFPKTDEQRARLCDSVKNILLFRSLDKEQMNEVLDAMFEKKVKAKDYIIKQGDDGDNFYVIESGVYKAYVGEDQKHIHTYENSGSFGELALLYNMPRAATIQAETEGQLWAMDRQTFRRILLKSAFRKRKMYEALLDAVPMLKTLQNYERMNLADALIPQTYSKGERIIKQGDVADGMYFIEDGKVSIRIQQDVGEVEISNLEKGQYFGELALVTHRPRAASAYAVDNVKVAFLQTDCFERLLGKLSDVMLRGMKHYRYVDDSAWRMILEACKEENCVLDSRSSFTLSNRNV
ncbi:cAMP-dependent protein kinase type II regulatory subunit isoform X1 [Wyeomyia smithii]|uniref:cAMP-dependent protein kinase type II regulatory subunit isoform X1 n=1 Tax=Wyeomyia smithii TaxID=174621 RepID=UPI0024681709|nr:cAMP-dependent protein kinase type II regulatory subunit isoform X1 [Wyeomyia smithii]XP_055536404.1 cAMP-dependent protein kinase type II regulatory subunit isoform X1 [Wyeomyia smithii]XP_055536405.1 cAMP-dependent protein kinase type II regulatory subunit isoform X1 [Wyeomyia smithii]XP_055536406.1 cAMP-dependent protein kinase type II regulatory subunit isoform X1 [Wyeomyia smithii]XP_055536407.1 cAMP-dependent protein kinase type II regulatory subunit isoform X1 [Wyeomyia smithii]